MRSQGRPMPSPSVAPVERGRSRGQEPPGSCRVETSTRGQSPELCRLPSSRLKGADCWQLPLWPRPLPRLEGWRWAGPAPLDPAPPSCFGIGRRGRTWGRSSTAARAPRARCCGSTCHRRGWLRSSGPVLGGRAISWLHTAQWHSTTGPSATRCRSRDGRSSRAALRRRAVWSWSWAHRTDRGSPRSRHAATRTGMGCQPSRRGPHSSPRMRVEDSTH